MPDQPNLPARLDHPAAPAPRVLPVCCGHSPEPDEPEIVPLTHYLWVLRRYRWRILGFIAIAVLATLIVSARLTPIFESTATLDVDRQTPTGVIGQESVRSALNDADQFLATQVRLIQSDSVLRPVVRQYRLYDPGAGPIPSAEADQAPVKLLNLKVTRPPNTYLLLISYRSPDPRLAAAVVNAIAQSYLEHAYNIRARSSASLSTFMAKQLDELRAKMEASSARLVQFERELNVINPEERTTILSSRLLQLNTEYTNAQADRVKKEAAYNSVRGGSLEAAQVSSQGEALLKLQERLNEAQEKFAQVRVQYGLNHPEYRKAATQLNQIQSAFDRTRAQVRQRVEIEYIESVNRESMLRKEVISVKREVDALNARSFEYQALKREAETDKKLYEELVRKIKEAGINASFQNNTVRLADPGRPAVKPVSPKIVLNLLIAFMLSAVLAVGAAVMADRLDNTLHDPDQARFFLGADVVGTLPLVKAWRARRPLNASNGTCSALVPLGESKDELVTSYAEAIRTLRNSIELSDFDRRLQSIMITSAAPGEGKTTVALHLAIAHAQQARTLLIDADLRRPNIHSRLNLKSETGLNEVLLGTTHWREALQTVDGLTNLDVLPGGSVCRRAADLLGHRLLAILEEASLSYETIVLDAPPLLGFAESLQLAATVDGVVIVTRAGQTNRNAVAGTLNRLTRLRANTVGLVLNGLPRNFSDRYYHDDYRYGSAIDSHSADRG